MIAIITSNNAHYDRSIVEQIFAFPLTKARTKEKKRKQEKQIYKAKEKKIKLTFLVGFIARISKL